MKERHLIILLTIAAIISCTHNENKRNERKNSKLVGTWRLIEYSELDSVNNKWTHPYGDHPKGFFTYTNNGIIHLNSSAEKPLNISPDSEYIKPITLGAVLDNAWGYFGTYSIDSVNSVVTHHVKGGSVISYIGTGQHRQFNIKGDTLLIGNPTFKVGKRVLIREE